jgi:hypothetical protein
VTPNPFASGKFGLIFGRPVSSPADQVRTATFDIEINYFIESQGGGIPPINVQIIPDVDGDTFPELAIMRRAYDSVLGNTSSMTACFAWFPGSALRGTPPLSFTFETPPTAYGREICKSVQSIHQTTDQNGDGYKNFLIASDTGMAWVIDGDDFATASTFTATYNAKPIVSDLGDIDGDGFNEFALGFQQLPVVHLLRGAALHTGQLGSNLLLSPQIQFMQAVPYTRLEQAPPVALGPTGPGQGGLIAFSFVSKDGISGTANAVATTAGQIVLVKAEDIRQLMVRNAPFLSIRVN